MSNDTAAGPEHDYKDLLKYTRGLPPGADFHEGMEERLARLNDCFLGFGSNPDENIDRLVALCGDIMGSHCALYNRLEGEQICSLGQWNTPSDYESYGEADGQICYDVIRLGEKDPIVIRNLQDTHYASSDPHVALYGLRTYIGIAVQWNRDAVGSLCVVYTDDVEPQGADLHLMNIIAGAIGVEEERKRSSEALEEALEEVEELKNRLEEENTYLREEMKTEYNFEEIVGSSRSLGTTLRKVEQVAPTDATVLIAGESGTGKELVARAIHSLSPRSEGPLVKVNCAAISAGLVESELFGHEKGAFTGAHERRIGRFELAHGGTLFLDEVGELLPETQVKLLRVLQEGEFERVGSSKTMMADVRVIAATNSDLARDVDEGHFRQDLYYRLNVFPIYIPPLRERKEDIDPLVEHFVVKYARKMGKRPMSVPEVSRRALHSYDWPGNVRELENVIERAVILTQGTELCVDDCIDIRAGMPAAGGASLEDVERAHIQSVLEGSGWVVEGERGAAIRLGINPGTLRSRMKKLGISRPDQPRVKPARRAGP